VELGLGLAPGNLDISPYAVIGAEGDGEVEAPDSSAMLTALPVGSTIYATLCTTNGVGLTVNVSSSSGVRIISSSLQPAACLL